MKSRTVLTFLVGGGAVITLGAPLVSKAQPEAPPVPVLEEEKGGLNGLGQSLRKFFEGFGGNLSEEEKRELDRALDDVQEELRRSSSEGSAEEESSPGDDPPRAQRERGSRPPEDRPRPRLRLRPNEPEDPSADLREQLRRHFHGMDLDQFFGDDFLGPFLRQMQRGGGAPDGEAFRRLFSQEEGAENRSRRYEKSSRRALAEFRDVVQEARESVATVFADGQQVALATVVTEDGHAVTKASMLGEDAELECEFQDGTFAKARLVDTNKSYDLALLKIETDRRLKPVEWNVEDNISAGTLLAAASPDEDPIAIGVVSVPARNLDSGSTGFLGIAMEWHPEGVLIPQPEGERPSVSPGSAAEKAGLKVGDVITAINGKPVRSPRELTDIVTSHRPYDEIELTYRRDGADHTAKAVLGSREEIVAAVLADGKKITESEFRRMMRQMDPTANMGGRGNSVADGFPTALQNDLFINVDECGGPIVGIDGRALGINIARAERTKTFAIPASTMKELLAEVKDGRLSQKVSVADLHREAREATTEVERLRQQREEMEKKLREAEERAKAAEEALRQKGTR